MLNLEKGLTVLKKSFVLLAFILALPATPPLKAQVILGSQLEQERQAKRGILFGVQLSPKAFQVLKRVDKLYGMPIRQYRREAPSAIEINPSAFVEIDGHPAIEIKRGSEVREDIIVHELCHLILTAEGRPVISFLPDDDVDMAEFQGLILNIISMGVTSPMDHAEFYPTLRKLGYDPDVEMRAYWTTTLKGFAVARAGKNSVAKAFYAALYYDLLLTITSENLRRDVKLHLEKNGQADAVARGERMADMYMRGRKEKKKLWLPLTLKLLNEAFDGYLVFSVSHDGVGKRGKIDYHSTILRVANHPARSQNGLKSPS